MKRMKFEGRRDVRRIDAETRQMGRDSLTPQEQLDLLDRRLGKGKGAVKERAKLKKAMEPKASKPKKVAEETAKEKFKKGKKQKS